MNRGFHICYVIAPGGGPETYVRNLGGWLIQKGYRVSVVTLGKKIEFSAGIHTFCASVGSAHYWVGKIFKNYKRWAQLVRSREWERGIIKALTEIEGNGPVDLVEVTEGISIGALKKRWKVVVRLHGSDWSFRHFCCDEGSWNNQVLIADEKKQLELADGVASISAHLAGHISKACEIPAEKIEFIPYPTPPESFLKSQEKKEKWVLCVGRLEKRKGTHVLVQAMESVWDRCPETELFLFGHVAGFSKEQLLAMVSNKNKNKIHFMGFVSQQTLADYYARAALYAAPTQYETFGYTLLEAMSFGVPVVTTPVGALPELVEDGRQGRLVPYGDPVRLAEAMVDILENPEKQKVFGENGRQKSLDYSLEKIGPRMAGFYESIMKGSN